MLPYDFRDNLADLWGWHMDLWECYIDLKQCLLGLRGCLVDFLRLPHGFMRLPCGSLRFALGFMRLPRGFVRLPHGENCHSICKFRNKKALMPSSTQNNLYERAGSIRDKWTLIILSVLPGSAVPDIPLNKLWLSCAKLSFILAIYARCANCFCKSFQYSILDI